MFGFNGSAHRKQIEQEAGVRRTFAGVISGVQFDLRHDDLPADRWACPPLLSDAPPGHPGFYIATDLGDDTATLGSTVGELAALALETARERGKEILFPGDRVSIRAVEFARPAALDPLTLVADQEAAVVYLLVQRAAGNTEALSPLYLRRRGRMGATFDEMGTLEAFADRLPLISDRATGAQEVIDLRAEVLNLKSRLEKTLADGQTANRTAGLLSLGTYALSLLDLERLVNRAALYGYRQASAEAMHTVEPLARKSLARQEQARQAARSNRDMARVQFAQDYWRESPQASAYAVAKAYRAQPGKQDEDQGSVIRSIKHLRPSNS